MSTIRRVIAASTVLLGLTLGATAASWAQSASDQAAPPSSSLPPQPSASTDGTATDKQNNRSITPASDQPKQASPQPVPSAPPAPREPVAVTEQLILEHPRVPTTSQLVTDTAVAKLSGIVGIEGEPADGLQSYIARAGNRVACKVVTPPDHVCVLQDGTDIAMIALVNGAAQTAENAPEPYRQQERLAQENRRGIWASLPPAPVALVRPTVRDTATLFANGRTYPLFGIRPVEGPYTANMQAFLNESGGKLTCEAQLGPAGYDSYVCLLPDGTDIAKFIVVNGAARVGPEAPDAYREQQAAAINQRRGIWATMEPEAIQVSVAESAPLDPEMYSYIPDDEAVGLFYVAGTPAIIVEDTTVFLHFVPDVGWGYWGYWGGGPRWYGCPGAYVGRLNRFYPGGRGLRATWTGQHFHGNLGGRYGLAPGGYGRPLAASHAFGGGRPMSSWAANHPMGGGRFGSSQGGQPHMGQAGMGGGNPGRGQFQGQGQGQFRGNTGGGNPGGGNPGGHNAMGGRQFGGGQGGKFVSPSQRSAPSQHFQPNFRSSPGGGGGFSGHGGYGGGGGHSFGGGGGGGGGHSGGGHHR